MKNNEKIDFGPLDPSKDEARWQLLVADTARRVRAQQRSVRTVSSQLVAWGPSAVAAAAALALVVWGGSWWAQLRTAEQNREAVRTEQAALLLRWALNDQLPPTEVLMQVAGEQ